MNIDYGKLYSKFLIVPPSVSNTYNPDTFGRTLLNNLCAPKPLVLYSLNCNQILQHTNGSGEFLELPQRH